MKLYAVMSVTLVFSLTASPCKAYLGDTLEQCTALLGKPTDGGRCTISSICPWDYMATFKWNGFTINISFRKNLSNKEESWAEIFQKIDAHNSDNYLALSDDDIKAFLKVESQGHQWTEITNTDKDVTWTRDDGAKASYEKGHERMLSFRTKAEVDFDESL